VAHGDGRPLLAAPGRQPPVLRLQVGKHALDAGVDLVTVSRLLGHERLETTATYTQPTAGDLEAAVAKLEADATGAKGVE
jgi:site-specific recombinase XerD